MTVSQTPAPARSDVQVPATTSTPAESTAESTARTGSTVRPYRIHGRVLSAGALLWAAATAYTGVAPETNGVEVFLFGLCSGSFQVGLLFLLRVLWRTQALGAGRLARFFLRFETGLISLAIGSTLADALQLSDLTQPGWALLDAFWPFSMLGMFLIGIRIAVAGRWTGASRFWPMVAESWAVVTIPSMMLFGYDAATVVSCLHLVIGYNVLGILVSRKER